MRSTTRLAQLVERQTGSVDGAYPTAIPGVTVFRRSTPSLPTGILYEPALCVVAQGGKQLTLAGREYHYDADHLLLIAGDVPAMSRIISATPQVPYLGIKVPLDPLEVGEVVTQLGPRPGTQVTHALAVAALDPGLLDAFTRLAELLASPTDCPVLGPLIRREIIYRLLIGPEGARVRQIVAGNDQGQRITNVLRWLKAHFAEPLRIDLLAKRAGMSPSAFHRHFKAVTALSPLQYQKCLRLQEARRLMLGGALDAAEASYRVGYESPSQFTREYRRLFGAPPRQDVEALREGVGPTPVVPLDLVRRRPPPRRVRGAPRLSMIADY